ncbi:nucleotide exchange factor GrpE [Sphingosinicella rhizophila]|uniref:Protein GrpE n=1 Tax=Sphingosinicella rhizophila TaxID=3050082 RepID=A0ABU3Q8Q4_9SPHN|nr:nucleotide exchange factor GrpE [Sphingosinicella sp. GR2756]MDT9599781.1 nucleotide exchange factor GrpE [Sphingosinicella sp. GR2756]
MNDEQNLGDDIQDSGQEQGQDRQGEGAEAPAEADRLSELAKELEEVRQHVLYAQAETQNVRRRLEQEKQNAAAYAATAFARDMLSVKDNLDRALAAIPEDLRSDEKMKPLVTGIEVTGRELDTVFQRNGITRIEAMGQPLDPNRHQAMVEIPSAEAEPGTIVQEMQAGYMIKDRLLRPALVGVARKD